MRLIFPIVVRLRGDQFKVAGETYFMNQHGLRAIPCLRVVEQSETRHQFQFMTQVSFAYLPI